MIIIIRISNKLNNVVRFILRKHLLNKTIRLQFHLQMFNHKKQPSITDTKEISEIRLTFSQRKL